ncbi:MAG: carbon-nitrogen hydrolase family protein [Methanobacteriota archaeon]|nr:MAG: carbon-nitrogen hydrolase family protein [Euryarchaeota archaeon]
MTKTTVTLAQVNCRLHSKDSNFRKMRSVVTSSKGRIVIFPELNMTGYMPRDDLFKLAETEKGPFVRKVVSLAKEAQKDVVFGMPMKDERAHGHIYNSCLLATGQGDLFRYDKMYLPTFGPFEERVFFAGGRNAMVADGMHARIGMTVCYDIFFPELVKLEALRGAQMIVNISAAPTTSRNSFERVMPARAVENGVFVAYVNMVGVHGSLVFSGGSVVYDPTGEAIARAENLKEDIVEAEIELTDLELARRSRPLARDIRPEVVDGLRSELGLGGVSRPKD